MSAPFRTARFFWQRLADHALFPVNMWLSEENSRRLGLTPIDHERIRAVLPHCKGRLLDVACGNNLLVRSYGNGVGCDIHPYRQVQVISESSGLPFRSRSFDSVALLACLNHITRRRETLDECRRILREDGRLLITMIHPWVGFFSHRIRRRHDPDQLERGMAREEDWGLSTGALRKMLRESSFRLTTHRRFMWGLNNFYLAQPEADEPEQVQTCGPR